MVIPDNIRPWISQFPQDQIPKLLSLVLESWKTFRIPNNRLEVPITKKFCAYLRARKDRSIHFFRIDWEFHVLNDLAKETGRIDLAFSHGYEENVYFSLECKRLRVNPTSGFKSLAGDYVKDGMLRYFNGQYATGLDKGGMLGYVMDGKVDAAIKDVTKAIETHRTSLLMGENETLKPSTSLRSSRVKETYHDYGPKCEFIVYHVFVNCS